MRTLFRRLLALTLTVLMLCSCTGCELLTEHKSVYGGYGIVDLFDDLFALFDTDEAEPDEDARKRSARPDGVDEIVSGEAEAGKLTELAFDELVYERPDFDHINAQIDELINLYEAGAEADAVIGLADELDGVIIKAAGQADIVKIRYYLNMADTACEEEYLLCRDATDAASNRLEEIETTICLDQDYYETACAVWGKDVVDDFIADNGDMEDWEAVNRLNARISELEDRYTTISSTGAVVEYEGEAWSFDSLYAAFYGGELDTETTLEIHQLLNIESGRLLQPVFLDLIDAKKQYAKLWGYETYPDYGYDCMGRDYSPAEARDFQAALKKTLVPLYRRLYEELEIDYYEPTRRNRSVEGLLATFSKVLEDFSPELKGYLDYMLRNRLYDLESREGKVSGALTYMIQDYKLPFIIGTYGPSSKDASVLTHEFGHFARFCAEPDINHVVYDLAEADSQGLEYLLYAYNNSFYGLGAEQATKDQIYYALGGLMLHCAAYDEFEQTVYGRTDLKGEELDDIMHGILRDYGLEEEYYEGCWAGHEQLFLDDCYFMSYTASMVPVLLLWKESLTDYDHARDLYLELLHRPSDASYMEVLKELGYEKPFSVETLQELADAVEQRFLD